MDEPASRVNEKAATGASRVIRVRHREVTGSWHLTAGRVHADEVVTRAYDNWIIAPVPFVDGVTRDVYEDPDSRQWVEGSKGERVSAEWMGPADEPVVGGRTQDA
jgi:hypothetical protein